MMGCACRASRCLQTSGLDQDIVSHSSVSRVQEEAVLRSMHRVLPDSSSRLQVEVSQETRVGATAWYSMQAPGDVEPAVRALQLGQILFWTSGSQSEPRAQAPLDNRIQSYNA